MQFVITEEFNEGEVFFYFLAACAEPGIGGRGKRTLSAQFGRLERSSCLWVNQYFGQGSTDLLRVSNVSLGVFPQTRLFHHIYFLIIISTICEGGALLCFGKINIWMWSWEVFQVALGCSGELQGGRSQVSARSSSRRSSKQEKQRGAHSSCKSSICAVWESGSSLYFKYTRVFPICAELERAHERDFSGFSG